MNAVLPTFRNSLNGVTSPTAKRRKITPRLLEDLEDLGICSELERTEQIRVSEKREQFRLAHQVKVADDDAYQDFPDYHRYLDQFADDGSRHGERNENEQLKQDLLYQFWIFYCHQRIPPSNIGVCIFMFTIGTASLGRHPSSIGSPKILTSVIVLTKAISS